MELELAPLNLPSDNERPFVIAGPCSAETLRSYGSLR